MRPLLQSTRCSASSPRAARRRRAGLCPAAPAGRLPHPAGRATARRPVRLRAPGRARYTPATPEKRRRGDEGSRGAEARGADMRLALPTFCSDADDASDVPGPAVRRGGGAGRVRGPGQRGEACTRAGSRRLRDLLGVRGHVPRPAAGRARRPHGHPGGPGACSGTG